MSTNDSASATPGAQSSNGVARLSLPSFTSIQNDRDNRKSQAESSTSGSRWSADDHRSRSPSDFRTSLSNPGSENGKQGRSTSNTFPRRNLNRTSGGFLLESTTHSSRLSRALLSRSQNDVKGKRKSGHSEIVLPKRRNRSSVLDQATHNQGSPLAVEVRQDQDGQPYARDNGAGSITDGKEREYLQNGLSGTPASQRSAVTSTGLETDAAQIVDMALKLSEGRRRQASGKRFVSGQGQGQRIVSTASLRQPQTPTKKMDKSVVSPTAVPRLPMSAGATVDGAINEDSQPMQIDDPFTSPTLQRHTSPGEQSVQISRATAARVEKAKIYLELAYEHRRLLSHLPPLQKHVDQSSSIEYGHKAYNPLQYVRNRKLRIREKSGINADADGWHDIGKVRAWVDAVIGSHSETNHDPLECVRLPPLSLKEDDEDEDSTLAAPPSPQSPRQQQTKLRRPKSDWVTHPGDLIADAFWLEQGLNKTKIQDSDNNPIYPANTPFKFSGWRNRTPMDIPESLQQLATPPEVEYDEPPLESVLSTAPRLPVFRSAHANGKSESHERKQRKLKRSIPKSRSDSRKRRLAFFNSSSDSESSSDYSSRKDNEEDVSRGRIRSLKEFNLPDGDPYGHPASGSRRDSKGQKSTSPSKDYLSEQYSMRSSADNSRLANYLKRNSTLEPGSRERGRSRGDTKKGRFTRQSRDSRKMKKQSKGPVEDDSEAPDSPINYGLPSITFNLDTPISRSPSPTKKSKSGLLQSLKDKSKHTEHDKIESTDFAKRHERSNSRDTIDIVESRHNSIHTSRGTSPLTRGTSPFSGLKRESTSKDDVPPSPVDHRASTISRQSTRQYQEQPSKIRGIFKGGRIAELVGNEVTRVGDFIWKRDVPPAYRRQMSGSETSIRTYDSSATDEEGPNGYIRKTPPRDTRQSIPNHSPGGVRRSMEAQKNTEKPQLYNANLPNFTSPFQRDREKQDKKQDFLSPVGPLQYDDHISRQAAQHRSRSKSPRMDRLAPLKIDTDAPRSVGVLERKNSYGFGDAFVRSQSASRAFNEVVNARSSVNGSARNSITGLANQLLQSATEQSKVNGFDRIDKRDLARIESLLQISAVKAKNISGIYEQIPNAPSGLLSGTIPSSDAFPSMSRSPQVRKRDEHVLAARNLITQLTAQTGKINDGLHSFSDTTVSQLHQHIQELEDQIENTITPRVRTAADNAGELGVKLTTTSTQAIKNLQDIISEAFRLRRRGPFRWVRLFWYTLIEWLVVGLLWFIWAIVTSIKLITGLSKGIGKTVRWLLWVE